MIEALKDRILRHENEQRHKRNVESGLLPAISSSVLLGRSDSDRIAAVGQNAVDEISARILAETGKAANISLRYVSPRADAHDLNWAGGPF